MSDYNKLMADDTNHALESNVYLDEIQKETDKEKRFQILKKYFTETITKNLYQNMDLLNASSTDFKQFKSMYIMIAKDLIINMLLAVNTLVSERGIYNLDPEDIDILSNIVGLTNSECEENEYSICEKCIMDSDF